MSQLVWVKCLLHSKSSINIVIISLAVLKGHKGSFKNNKTGPFNLFMSQSFHSIFHFRLWPGKRSPSLFGRSWQPLAEYAHSPLVSTPLPPPPADSMPSGVGPGQVFLLVSQFLLSPSPMAFSAFSQFPQNTHFSSIFIEHLFMLSDTTVDAVMSCPDHFSKVEDLLLSVRLAESPQLSALSGELPQRKKTSSPNFTPPSGCSLIHSAEGLTHCLCSGRLCRVPSSRMWG